MFGQVSGWEGEKVPGALGWPAWRSGAVALVGKWGRERDGTQAGWCATGGERKRGVRGKGTGRGRTRRNQEDKLAYMKDKERQGTQDVVAAPGGSAGPHHKIA